MVNTKMCATCKEEKDLIFFAKNNQQKDGYHCYCRDCNNERGRLKYDKVKEKDRWLKRTYGITQEEWQKMFLIQNGACAICNKHQSESSKALHTDHSHVTGKVRGLLCAYCNHSLGFVENSELLAKALEYLRKTSV